jgi:hypothetical protein
MNNAAAQQRIAAKVIQVAVTDLINQLGYTVPLVLVLVVADKKS